MHFYTSAMVSRDETKRNTGDTALYTTLENAAGEATEPNGTHIWVEHVMRGEAGVDARVPLVMWSRNALATTRTSVG